MEILEKLVLVCDDERWVFDRLKERFDRYNESPLSSENLDVKFRFQFTYASTIDETADQLKGHTQWDVIVIDRRFEKAPPGGEEFWSQHILRALNDLQSDAVRIVFTAHMDSTDLIQCMRLGAWDYIYKNEPKQRMGSSYQDVVDSAVKGLAHKRIEEQRQVLAEQAMYWMREHKRKLLEEFPEQFVPLRKLSEGPAGGNWEILRDAVARSLFQTYEAMRQRDIAAEQVHIVWVEGPRA